MRIPTLLSSLVLAACLAGATVVAVAQEPVETVPVPTETTDDDEVDEEEFGRDFDAEDMRDLPAPREEDMPRLQPIAPRQPVEAAPPPGTLPVTGADQRVLAVAAYWLLLAGITLRRAARVPGAPA